MIRRRTLLGAGAASIGLVALSSSAVLASRRIPWHGLERRLGGDLVLPDDPEYVIARQLELGQFDEVNPKAVAYCTSTRDVSLVLRFAQDHGLDLAVRSGGHSFGGYSTSPGIVLDLSRMNRVAVGDGRVDIGPGAQNIDVLNGLAPHGLVLGGGGCPTVAAGGFLQGGGFGLLTRPLGMTCDSLVSAEVVLADGSVVTASEEEHEDLFWALRGGGGGSFGVVTGFTATPHTGDRMAMVNLTFGYDRAVEVLDGVASWLADAPDGIGGGAYLRQYDAAPGNDAAVNVMLSLQGTSEDLAGEADRLLALTGAALDRQDAEMTYQQLMAMIYGCAELTEDECRRSEKYPDGQLTRPAFGLERTRLFSTAPSNADWARVVSAFDDSRRSGQARFLDLHLFGGRANGPERTATAYVHRDSEFSVNYRVLIEDPDEVTEEATDTATRWVDQGFGTIDPLSNGETYQNWMDPSLEDWRESYYAENHERLVRVANAYDPDTFFTFPQAVRSRS